MSATISAESGTGNGVSFHSLYAGILSRTVVSHLYSQLVGRGKLVKIDQIANWG
jgi:hypothetical protein